MIENLQDKIKKYIINNIWHVILTLLIIVNIGLSVSSFSKFTNEETNIVEEKEELVLEPKEANTNQIVVDIKGMVKKPGVYIMDDTSTVNDLLNIAGGLKSGGSTVNINLSKRLTDQMVVIISSSKDLKSTKAIAETNCSDYNLNTCKNGDETLGVINNSSSNISGKISINNATIEELMTLSGIGLSKAEAIINYRDENGPFSKIEDLLNVNGIGESTFANIKENITL